MKRSRAASAPSACRTARTPIFASTRSDATAPRAETALTSEAHLRRAFRRARNDRDRLRLRRGVDAHARRRRATATFSTARKCRSPTGRRRDGGVIYARPTASGSARHHRLCGRESVQGIFHRTEARQARHARFRPANCCSRTARCRRRTCSGASVAASMC